MKQMTEGNRVQLLYFNVFLSRFKILYKRRYEGARSRHKTCLASPVYCDLFLLLSHGLLFLLFGSFPSYSLCVWWPCSALSDLLCHYVPQPSKHSASSDDSSRQYGAPNGRLHPTTLLPRLLCKRMIDHACLH